MRENLIKTIMNEQITETNPSLEGISKDFFYDQNSSLYLGTGLCTYHSMSIGLPFDVLSMILTAEKLRRDLGMKETFHQIADTHAKSNKFYNENEIDELAKRERDLLIQIVEKLRIPNYNIILASETESHPVYIELFEQVTSKVPTDTHEYRIRELTDIEWFRVEKNVKIKIGWTIDGGTQHSKFDERSYDSLYKECVSDKVSFVYVKAGRILDKKRPKASPYISIAGETRIMIDQNEDPKQEIGIGVKNFNGDKTLGSALKYYVGILRLYQSVVGKLESNTVEDRIKEVLDKIFEV